MASTYSTNLAIELIGTGDQAGTWGNTTNTNLGTLIEQAISGYVTQAVSTGTDTTITIPNGATGVARNMYIELTGTGGTNTNLIVPANKKLYFIFNNTSSGQVTVKVSGQTGVSVPNKAKVILVSNGTDIIDATNYIGSAVIGNITATSGTITTLASTSAIITTLTSTSAGITTLSSGSANITQLNSTSGTISTLASTSAAITTLSGTTLTYSSASITNLTATSLVLSNLSIASANITTLTSSSATISTTLVLSGGTANGVLYLNGSKVATSGSALTFDGGANLSTGGSNASTYNTLNVNNTASNGFSRLLFNIGTSGANGTAAIKYAPGVFFAIGPDANDTTTPIVFNLNNATEQMRLTSTGLGIGTSSPAFKLDVNGSTGIRITGMAGVTNSAIYIPTGGVLGDNIGTFEVRNGGGTSSELRLSSRGFHTFFTGGSGDLGTGTERMRLDSAGNLGIGTSSPSGFLANKLVIATGGTANEGMTIYSSSNNGSIWFADATTGTGRYAGGLDYTHSDDTLIFYSAAQGNMRLNASGNLGLGVTPSAWSVGKAIEVAAVGNAIWGNGAGNIRVLSNSYYDGAFKYATSSSASQYAQDAGTHAWSIAASGTAGNTISFTQAMTLDASGRLGIGTTSPASGTRLHMVDSAGCILRLVRTSNRFDLIADTDFLDINARDSGTYLRFLTADTERARITSGGDFLLNGTTANAANCITLNRGGGNPYIWADSDNESPLYINRRASDGNLVQFYQDTVQEGSISVSGNTVSYNAFAGSHWSQLQDDSKPDILRGTVMESINELCVWPDEQNERLPKSKISDTAGSKKVYGVFMAWDNDWTTTNDMYVTAVGAFICRVNGSVTVQEGDLLESNGDGTARVQADDIIRSSTIGKVTSTVKTHEYDDGSYCVPTVLYCG